MSKSNLPEAVNPVRYAEQATHLHGSMLLQGMDRLRTSLFTDEGEVEVDFEFGIDRQKTRFVKTQFAAKVTLQCQRCLESFLYDIQGDLISGLVTSEDQIPKLPEHYEPLLIIDENLVLRDLIEEELIISLPIVPMHDPMECKTSLPVSAAMKDEQVMKDNPFKVIEALKSKPKD